MWGYVDMMGYILSLAFAGGHIFFYLSRGRAMTSSQRSGVQWQRQVTPVAHWVQQEGAQRKRQVSVHIFCARVR